MNKAAKVVLVIGIVMIIIGIILFATTGDNFDDTVEEGIVSEGADGKT